MTSTDRNRSWDTSQTKASNMAGDTSNEEGLQGEYHIWSNR